MGFIQVARTHGNNVSNASVIPKPARKIGVKPMRGLIKVPVNGPTGVCYDEHQPRVNSRNCGSNGVPHEMVPPPDFEWPRYRV
jgi:hypothetical protein